MMVQLARNVGRSLLSTFNRKPSSSEAKPCSEPEDVTALPIETSDDDSAQEDFHARYADSSDDGGLSNSADLVRSDLRAKQTDSAKSDEGVAGSRSISTRLDGSSISKRRWQDDIDEDEEWQSDALVPNKKSRTAEHGPRTYGKHMKSGWLVERKIDKAKKPAKVTYGAKSATSSQRSATQEQAISADIISDSASPERPKFKHRAYQSHDPSPALGLNAPGASEREASPLTDVDSEAPSDPPGPSFGDSNGKRPNRRRSSRFKRPVRDLTPEPVSQRPEFKMPDEYTDYTPNAFLIDLNQSLSEAPAQIKKANLDLAQASCPLCEEEVDEKWLEDFSRGRRMTIARQAKFCRLHKRKSAQEIWDRKGYPVIDWTNLETRIRSHHGFVEALIRGKASHFGAEHLENIKAGQNRTLLKTDDYLTPGYYGLRGMSLMTETIIEIFSPLLRERAPRDKLISARGYTGFVQSVLVPELAVKLVQEDMSIGVDEARKVLQDSRAVGEVLNDERREQKQAQAPKLDATDVEDGGAAVETASEKDNLDDKDEPAVQLRIQDVVDSDSELSSITTMSVTRRHVKEAPVTTHAPDIDDSDSELSSVGDW